MKFTAIACLLFASLAPAAADNRAITKVVKLLEDMLEKSKADGESDRVIYAKFKCYCDTQTETKTKEIDGLTQDISLLESKIAELQGSTGGLSTECAKLKADMAANEQERAEAQALRDKENAAFLAEEADLTQAIAQMKDALKVLADVGADQTVSVGADHTMAMGGFEGASLLKLKSQVTQALTAAAALAPSVEKRNKVAALLQAPFTGTYTAQSGEVVGILANMRDTFKANLASAIALEASQKEAHEAFMATKLEEYNTMSGMYDEKQSALGGNDDELASSKQLLATAEESKATKEQFLAELEPLCAEKTKEYDQRKALRANEDAAIAEAISILNSDAAFETFGKVDATTTGATAFFQRSAVSKHNPLSTRQRVQDILRKAGSARLVQLASVLAAGNPFDVVLTEIEKMLTLISEEGKADSEKRSWCRTERENNNKALKEKETQIISLTGTINELTDTIENPETGLKVMIANDETSLLQNLDNQKTSTEQRQTENAAYTADIGVLTETRELLGRAIKVLSAYYATLEPHQLDEAKEVKTLTGETDAAPDTWEGEQGYKGQSSSGNKAVDMLEFILDETKKEESVAHTDELTSQHSFEDLMTGLKAEQKQLEESIASLKETLAEKEAALFDAKKQLEETEAEKAAILEYLASIKPGCDFIEANFDLREDRRASETDALNNAITLIKGTPAYQAAVSAADVESLGDCKDICLPSREHVKCKACLAKVTVPGYCAGHEGTEGC